MVVATLSAPIPNPTPPRKSPFIDEHPSLLRQTRMILCTSFRGASSPTNARPTENADYPRPGAQGEGGETETHPPPHNEEEAPKKEKKHGHGGHDQNRLKESVHRKVDATAPSKDHLSSKHSFGAGGRIGQPMGKSLAI